MLDTIILTMPLNCLTITKPDNFNPPARGLANISGGFRQFYNNPTAEDKRLCVYKPLLTLTYRYGVFELKIQFSAPKLLYKNNLQELQDNQFGEVVDAIHKKVFDMGVYISKDNLKKASVSSFHPSKNILITGGYSANAIIAEFAKVNFTEKLDLDHKAYRNSGHGLQFYAKSHALTFYDKIQDLQKPEKRSYGKDQKLQQLSLFDFRKQKIKPEILRMEARLNDKRKMNSVLVKLGFKANPIFSEIFKSAVCQKILLDYFKTYIEPGLFIFDFEDTPLKILKSIFKNNPKIRPSTAFGLTALKLACKDKGGVRDLRKMLSKITSERNWDRVALKIKVLNKRATIEHCHEYIKQIKVALQEFKPYNLPQTAIIEPPKPVFDPMSLH